jgi:hypothetical protein
MLKEILFRMKIKGQGIVNYDSDEQRYAISKTNLLRGMFHDENGKLVSNENIQLAKKVLYDDGTYKIKISSDCLRSEIFGKDIDVITPSIIACDNIFCSYLLSPVGIVRGYMFTEKNRDSYKRKSPFRITDAIQTNDAKSFLEICSKHGERSNNSMFYKENVGDIEYYAEGNIDICGLSFISADPIFDRLGMKSEWINTGIAEKILKKHYGDLADVKFGHFTRTNAAMMLDKSYCECGILLGNKLIEYLIKDTLTNILNMKREMRSSYAYTSCLEIKFVDDILAPNQSINSDEGWITITCDEDIKNLNINLSDSFYVESTDNDIKNRDKMQEEYNNMLKEQKDIEKTQKEKKTKIKIKI